MTRRWRPTRRGTGSSRSSSCACGTPRASSASCGGRRDLHGRRAAVISGRAAAGFPPRPGTWASRAFRMLPDFSQCPDLPHPLRLPSPHNTGRIRAGRCGKSVPATGKLGPTADSEFRTGRAPALACPPTVERGRLRAPTRLARFESMPVTELSELRVPHRARVARPRPPSRTLRVAYPDFAGLPA